MVLSNRRIPQSAAVATLTYRVVYRSLFALCMILAPLAIFLSFAVDPTNGVPGNAHRIFTTFRAASDGQIQWFLFFNTSAVFLFALSYVGLGMLCIRGAPWLAIIGTVFGLLGSLPWAFFVSSEALAFVLSRTANESSFVAIWNSVSAVSFMVILQYSWVIGHLLGYVLLGIALARSRVVPLWIASLFIIGVPLQMAAYPTNQGILQILGFVLVFIGSIFAAVALLKETFMYA